MYPFYNCLPSKIQTKVLIFHISAFASTISALVSIKTMAVLLPGGHVNMLFLRGKTQSFA